MNITIDSYTLLRPVDVCVAMPYSILSQAKPYTVIWVLHPALSGSHLFFDHLCAASYVDKKNCVIIAPNLGNGYFINSNIEQQADFLQDELFPYIYNILPLSKKREDTFLLGISAGAFGAINWVENAPQHFSKVALISGCYSYFHKANDQLKHCREQYAIYQLAYKKILPSLGDETLFPTDNDMTQILPTSETVQNWPRVSLFCGAEDYLSLPSTQIFYDACKKTGLNIALNTSSGGHNNTYWAKVFPDVIDWLVQK